MGQALCCCCKPAAGDASCSRRGPIFNTNLNGTEAVHIHPGVQARVTEATARAPSTHNKELRQPLLDACSAPVLVVSARLLSPGALAASYGSVRNQQPQSKAVPHISSLVYLSAAGTSQPMYITDDAVQAVVTAVLQQYPAGSADASNCLGQFVKISDLHEHVTSGDVFLEVAGPPYSPNQCSPDMYRPAAAQSPASSSAIRMSMHLDNQQHCSVQAGAHMLRNLLAYSGAARVAALQLASSWWHVKEGKVVELADGQALHICPAMAMGSADSVIPSLIFELHKVGMDALDTAPNTPNQQGSGLCPMPEGRPSLLLPLRSPHTSSKQNSVQSSVQTSGIQPPLRLTSMPEQPTGGVTAAADAGRPREQSQNAAIGALTSQPQLQSQGASASAFAMGSGSPAIPSDWPSTAAAMLPAGGITTTPLMASAWDQASSLRGLSILSQVPLLITLLDMESGAVFQNELSICFWGHLQQLQALPLHNSSMAVKSLLRQLMPDSPHMVDELLECVRAGQAWKKLLRVPPHCSIDMPPDVAEHGEGEVATRQGFGHAPKAGGRQPLDEGNAAMLDASHVPALHEGSDIDGITRWRTAIPIRTDGNGMLPVTRAAFKLQHTPLDSILDDDSNDGVADSGDGESDATDNATTFGRGMQSTIIVPFQGSRVLPKKEESHASVESGVNSSTGQLLLNFWEKTAGSSDAAMALQPPRVQPCYPARAVSSRAILRSHTTKDSPSDGAVVSADQSQAPPGSRPAAWPARHFSYINMQSSSSMFASSAGAGAASWSNTGNSGRTSLLSCHSLHMDSPMSVQHERPASGSNAQVYRRRPCSTASFSQLSMEGSQVMMWDNPAGLAVQPSQKLRSLMAFQESRKTFTALSSQQSIQPGCTPSSEPQNALMKGSSSKTLQDGSQPAVTAVGSALDTLTSAVAAASLGDAPGNRNDTAAEWQEERAETVTWADDVTGVNQSAVGEQQYERTSQPHTQDADVWHNVEAVPFRDPVTDREMLLLLQTDMSSRVHMELRMAALNETQVTMLDKMFPRHVLEYMAHGGMASGSASDLATSHQNVTIMFMDIVGFTTMSKEVEAVQVMSYLNSLFTLFDELIDQYGVYKVETAGDCYIVAGALMQQDADGFQALGQEEDAAQGAENVMGFAKAILRCAKTVALPHTGEPTRVRVGMHTGPVVTGLIGTKLPKFSIFGDTMNTASRMESTSQPGCIHVSQATHGLLSHHTFKPTGGGGGQGEGGAAGTCVIML